ALQLGYAWISSGELSQADRVFADVIQQARTGEDPRLEGWGLSGQGDVLVSQGDGPGALAAYQAGLTIAEGLAKRDPANTEWQVDVTVSCWKLGSLDALLTIPERRTFFQRGRQILGQLKAAGRLQANQDWISAFDQALAELA
ncbi:MAG: hypothetical protein ACKO45_00660, partial [Cyanobium sp.]